MSDLKLSVILSLRNEEAVLRELIHRLLAVFATLKVPYELIFVNDASTDGTQALLDEYAHKHAQIKILHMSRRFGVQASILAGIQHASGDAVITMDADLQDPPELIPAIIEKWQSGADIVHMVRSQREGETWIKRKITTCAYRLIRFLSDIPFPIEAGDFKLMSRRVVNELLNHPERMPYLRGLITSLGFCQATITYRREKRFAGKSHFSLLGRGPLETFLAGVISFSPVPLYGILLTGLILLAISFLACLILPLFFFSHWTLWLITGLSFLTSLNLTALGILGLYVWYMVKQTQGRPLYILERKVNF